MCIRDREALLQDIDAPDVTLPDRMVQMASRVNSARAGMASQPLEPGMEVLYRKVSDKQTMGSVVGELKVTLAELERDLDPVSYTHLEGDLTQEATVTEDITGAIADSVNYTVEELRSLVGNVQSTATRVAQDVYKRQGHASGGARLRDQTCGRQRAVVQNTGAGLINRGRQPTPIAEGAARAVGLSPCRGQGGWFGCVLAGRRGAGPALPVAVGACR